MCKHRSESPLVALEEEGRECRIYEIAVSLLGLTGYKFLCRPALALSTLTLFRQKLLYKARLRDTFSGRKLFAAEFEYTKQRLRSRIVRTSRIRPQK